jgi:hypothetical protein
MERIADNGIMFLFQELQLKINKFEKQIKLNSDHVLVTFDLDVLFDVSDYIDKFKKLLKNNKMDRDRVVKLYSYLISKDPELTSLARVIIDNA